MRGRGGGREGLECAGSPLQRHRSLPSRLWPWRGATCWSSGTCDSREDSPAGPMPSAPGGLAGGVLPESVSCFGVSSGILSFHDARGSFRGIIKTGLITLFRARVVIWFSAEL